MTLRSIVVLLATMLALLGSGCRSSVDRSPVVEPPVRLPLSLPSGDVPLTTIAFGSCSNQALEQPIWDTISGVDADLFVFAGDIVYSSRDPATLEQDWAAFLAKPGFRRFRHEVPILAIWDDHDYGINDGGADHPDKARYAQALLDVFDPPTSKRRGRPGLYDAHVFGPKGKRVQVILLDLRSFRGPLVRHPAGDGPHGRYLPQTDPTVTMLGEEQWRWLESVLREPAELRLVISSVQAVASEHGWEMWANLPHERERFLRTIRDSGAAGVVVLSGDRHLAELSMLDADDPRGVGYPLYDLTASGLTHAGGGRPDEPNRHRVLTDEPYRGLNFGVVRVDWAPDVPTVTLEVHDLDGVVVLRHTVPLASLQPPS